MSSASSVDLSGRDFRAVMYYDCFGDQSPPKATFFRWFRQFMSGARTLEDDDRCDRMAMTITPENVSRVESLIKKDTK